MKLSASLYAADPMRLGRQAEAVAPHVASLHVDVMDGAFAPAFGLGERLVRAIAGRHALPVDVHLMVADPGRWIRPFADAGARRIVFHLEATDDPRRLAAEIRARDCEAHLALLPGTPLRAARACLDAVDGLLLLTAPPGGGPFDEAALDRASAVPPGTRIIVDGGIEPSHFDRLRRLPIELVVVGRTLFGADDVATRARQLRAALGDTPP